VLKLLRHAGTERAHLRFDDLTAAGLILVLVSATALPGLIPVLLLDDHYLALRVANAGQVLLLFFIGFGWAGYSGAPRWRTGALIALLGVALVLISVALGG
jgi:VIT1/CCC1 family predicted Fe2+/Mn2+ transporter